LQVRILLGALGQRAWARAGSGDSADALADYDSLLALAELSAEHRMQVLFNLGVTKWEVGNLAGALDDFDAFLALSDLPA
jgi:hypothetical protein